jgi:hypothetical protein
MEKVITISKEKTPKKNSIKFGFDELGISIGCYINKAHPLAKAMTLKITLEAVTMET